VNLHLSQSKDLLGLPLKATPLAFVIGLLSCGDDPCPVVGMPQMPAIILEVLDAQTDAPILAGVSGIAVVNGETIPFAQDADSTDNILWIYGPKGEYEVFLAKTGYRAWYRSDIQVTGSHCEITSERLKAELVPIRESQTLLQRYPY
jgi:hypothetical protein